MFKLQHFWSGDYATEMTSVSLIVVDDVAAAVDAHLKGFSALQLTHC